MSTESTDVEQSVRKRYSEAAGERTEELCCPVTYDARFLEVIPEEILERDYGCGDPSKHLKPGETVLDLGSGGGKICYIASQVVGSAGRVIGVDMNDDMLRLAESYRVATGDRIGHHNVEFRKGRIQDLALDYRKLEDRLATHPVTTPEELEALETWKGEQRKNDPLIPDTSVDVIVSNCVLNLVRPEDKQALFREMHRVLRVGGRAVISDIVADEDIPQDLADDPELWSGCVSGAYREDQFLEAFAEAGFQGMRILVRNSEPWRVVRGIEFRSLTVEAFKFDAGSGLERRQAVIYTGPWRSVTDDDGHTLHRGERMAVCDRSYRRYTAGPYSEEVLAVPPRVEVPVEQARSFGCERDRRRPPAETKGDDYDVTLASGSSCCGTDKGN